MSKRVIIIEVKSDSKGFHWEYLPNDEMQLLPTNTWIIPALQILIEELPDDLTEMYINIKTI